MARQLRLQYPGALYHIINRGNYRRDIFEATGATVAFLSTLGETCTAHRWVLHAFTIMRNHFHLALETPEANLADGMQWLQATYACRFNRFRAENGHLFQGRYRALVIEDDAALINVVDYIHLNPVRAGIVLPTHAANYRWSSLTCFVEGPRPLWLVSKRWLAHLQLDDSAAGWARYLERLTLLNSDAAEQERRGFDNISKGWAIGTAGWKRAIAKEHAQLALNPGLPYAEIRDLREASWQIALEKRLQDSGHSRADITIAPTRVRWKLEIAGRLRKDAGAPYRWIAEGLKLGSPVSLRVAIFRLGVGSRQTPSELQFEGVGGGGKARV